MINLVMYLESKIWQRKLSTILRSSETKKLDSFLTNELKSGRIINPELENVFRALNLCPPSCQVVILGQDPYHTPGKADGLAFSSRERGPLPPSLRNIYKELSISVYKKTMEIRNGDLTLWADQGVMLLNTRLTVGAKPMSHASVGWERITKRIIEILVADESPKVFMIWGREVEYFVNSIPYIENQHLWLTAAHPSPLSARRGFFGCNHFNVANDWLRLKDQPQIDWGVVFKGYEKAQEYRGRNFEEDEGAYGEGNSRRTG